MISRRSPVDSPETTVNFTWWAGRSTLGAERLDRDTADQHLLKMATAEKFDGPISKRLLTDMGQYGITVITLLIQSGEVFARLRKLLSKSGQGFSILTRPLTGDEINQLAYDSVLKGIDIFIDKELAGKGWTPELGAALTTYFVNGCILGFRTPWKGLTEKSGKKRIIECAIDEALLEATVAGESFEEAILEQVELDDYLRRIPNPESRLIMLMVSRDESRAAIAEIVGITEAAVNQRVRRIRKSLEQNSSMPGGSRQ